MYKRGNQGSIVYPSIKRSCMKQPLNSKQVGMLLVAVGIILFAFTAWDRILAVAGAFLALAIINYGLQMQGLPQVHVSLQALIDLLRR